MHDLTAVARQVATLLAGVTDAHLTAPTPCGGYRVADLLDHLMGLTVAFRATAEKAPMPPGESPPGEGSGAHLDPRWRDLLPERLGALAASWQDPAAWTGESRAGGVTAPAEVLGGVAAAELVLHGWDLARATGQPFAPDPDAVAATLGFTAVISAPGMEEARGSAFAAPVPVPDGVSDLERAVAQSGRDPWSGPPR